MFELLEKLCVKLDGRCNFNCLYCHQPLVEKLHKDFSDFDQLEKFLQSFNNYAKEVEIVCGGGEPTLVPNLIRKMRKISDRLEQSKGISVNLGLVTNGSKLPVLNSLIEDDVIHPRNVSMSWDGDAKTRQSNTQLIDNLCKYKFYRDINVTYAITPMSVNHMIDDFMYCWDRGIKDLSYYFIHEGDYSDPTLKFKFKLAIDAITKEFLIRKRDDELLKFFNFEYWHYCNSVKKAPMCNKLGKGFSVALDGKVYPCIYFGDHHKCCIGDIYNGLNQELIDKFLEEYNHPYTCNWKSCLNHNCQECPASNSVHNGGCYCKTENICGMHDIERNIYSQYKCDNKFYEPMFDDHVPLFMREDVNSNLSEQYGIKSPALEKVKHWNE